MADNEVTGDVVVLLPGIMGSSLLDADGREVWGLSTSGLLRALWSLGDSVRDLTLPDDVGDGPAPDGVRAGGLLPGFHVIPGVWSPVEGYAGILKFLGSTRFGLIADDAQANGAPPGNLVVFPYDWRLSIRWLATVLQRRAESALERWRASAPERRDARLVLVGHSMGGLVARWYVERLSGAEVTRALVTLGTPHRGSLKALEQLVNGVRKGPGPLKADLTRFARSLPSSYQLLPEYACLDGDGGALLKTTESTLPHLDTARVADGMQLHEELDAAAAGACPIVPISGIGQPTWATGSLTGDSLRPLRTIAGADRGGDGTVPRFAARPKRMSEHDVALRGVADGHGRLVSNRGVRDQLDFLITAEDRVYRAAPPPAQDAVLGLAVNDLHDVGEPVSVEVSAPERRVLAAVVSDEHGAELGRELVRFSGELDASGRHLSTARFEGLPPGGYTINVGAPDDVAGIEVAPVRATTLVWGA